MRLEGEGYPTSIITVRGEMKSFRNIIISGRETFKGGSFAWQGAKEFVFVLRGGASANEEGELFFIALRKEGGQLQG